MTKYTGGAAIVALTLAVGVLAGGGAHAADVQDLGAGFADDGWSEIGFVAEGRIGSNSVGGATFEYDLGPNTGSTAKDEGELFWGNGVGHDFTLTFNGSDATFAIEGGQDSGGAAGDDTLEYTFGALPSSFNALMLRIGTGDNGNITLSDLKLDGGTLGAGGYSFGPDASQFSNYWGITGLDTNNFTITGTAAMSWTGTAPKNSNLSFQFKGANAPVEVPMPATLALLGMGLAGLGAAAAWRRRA